MTLTMEEITRIEREIIRRTLKELAQLRFPEAKLEPAGDCKTLDDSITFDDWGDVVICMLYYNVGKDTRGERMDLEPKGQDEQS